jgi:hypothetical protein
MEPIKVLVYVSLRAAVAAGRTSYGYAAVPLDADAMANLSVEARSLLAIPVGSDEAKDVGATAVLALDITGSPELHADDATPAAVTRALEDLVSTRRAREEATKAHAVAQQEALVKRALDTPDERWVLPGGLELWQRHAPTLRIPAPREDFDSTDPRIVARVEHIEANVLPVAVAAWRAACAEYDARVLSEDAERKAALAAAKAKDEALIVATREYVLKFVPDYRRAAENGLDVEDAGCEAAKGEVDAQFATAAEQAGLVVVDDTTSWKPRKVPTDTAFVRAETLERAVRETIASMAPELRALLGEPKFAIVRAKVGKTSMPDAVVETMTDKPFTYTTLATVTIRVGRMRTVSLGVDAEPEP